MSSSKNNGSSNNNNKKNKNNNNNDDDENNNSNNNNNKQPPHKIQLIKFPRTHHLFDTGNSTARDDLVLDKKEAEPFYTKKVTIEEKVDGSNLGISIDPETYKILCQNRSHYVTSQSASQFATLDAWVQKHSAALFEMLYPDYILYGEWLYTVHTVFYDKLPGPFIAFDIYDKKNGKFLSVTERNKKLAGSGIPVVRCIKSGVVLSTEEEYRRIIMTEPSAYSTTNSPLEGIYLRVDDENDQFLVHRCKLVRPEFINTVNNSSHWSKQIAVKNIVVYDGHEYNIHE